MELGLVETLNDNNNKYLLDPSIPVVDEDLDLDILDLAPVFLTL